MKGRTWRRRQKRHVNLRVEARSDDIALLLDWFNNNGGFLNNLIRIHKSKDGCWGLALVRKSKIQSNELFNFVSVPRQLLFTVNNGKLLNGLQTLRSKIVQSYLSELGQLAILLAIEKQNTQSFFGPYFSSLPTSFAVPLIKSTGQLILLPRGLHNSVCKQLEIIDGLESFCSQLPGVSITRKELLWSWAAVNTRSVSLLSAGTSRKMSFTPSVALAPVLDMFNHSHSAHCVHRYGADGSYKLSGSLTWVRRYGEVYINYGPHSNQTLLVDYGFVEKGNPHDCVPVSLEELEEAVFVFRRTSGDKESIKKYFSFLNANGLTRDIGFTWDGATNNLVTCLRILLHPGYLSASNLSLLAYDARLLDSSFSQTTKQCLVVLIRKKLEFVSSQISFLRDESTAIDAVFDFLESQQDLLELAITKL